MNMLKERKEQLKNRFDSEVKNINSRGFNNAICTETGVRYFFDPQDGAKASVLKVDDFRRKNPQLNIVINKSIAITIGYSGFNFPHE